MAARNISNSKYLGEGGGRWAGIRLNRPTKHPVIVVAPVVFIRPSEMQKFMKSWVKRKVSKFCTFEK